MKMQWMTRVAALALLAMSFAVPAMTVEAHGNMVFARGPVDDDLRKFEEAFAKGGIDTVVFVNSPGGDLWTGLRIGQLIADKGYKTVIAGYCVSACSIMYMGGKERRFSDAMRSNLTHIGIHGAHNKDTKQINPAMQPQIFAFYKQYMGDKFNSAIMNQALYDMDDSGSLLIVRDAARSAHMDPFHCKSSQTPRDQCTKFPGQTAMSLGITTHADLVKLELPPSFRQDARVANRDLPAEAENLAGMLNKIAQTQCSTDSCRASTAKYGEHAQHRALASGTDGRGLAWSTNADTLDAALLRAVYSCNHMANLPARLCEAELVNNHPVRQFYRESDESHKSALTHIKPPADKFYANEEYGGGFTKMSGYRTEKFTDITPQSVDDIKTVGTQELARMITSGQRPIVIDVGAFFDTIPGSVGLVNGGIAFADAARDEAVNKRFAHMMSVIAPEKAANMVFFCASRNCWTSANAALRAKNLGYTNVMWYRGGIEAWKASGLPTAMGVVRAVAN
jgi:rhodanese-related sulfurtransferase